MIKANKLILGHNADDIAETVLMNLLRGDAFRLGHCTNIANVDEDDEISENSSI